MEKKSGSSETNKRRIDEKIYEVTCVMYGSKGFWACKRLEDGFFTKIKLWPKQNTLGDNLWRRRIRKFPTLLDFTTKLALSTQRLFVFVCVCMAAFFLSTIWSTLILFIELVLLLFKQQFSLFFFLCAFFASQIKSIEYIKKANKTARTLILSVHALTLHSVRTLSIMRQKYSVGETGHPR